MALLKEHLSHINRVLSGGDVSDDFQFPDAQLYFILKAIRSYLLRQRITEGKYISYANYQAIPCLKLSYSPIQDCPCFSSDCKALQTNCNIPTIISSTKGLIVSGVYTINTPIPTQLAPLRFDEYRLSQYSKTMQEVKGWFIPDGTNKMFIVGLDRLAGVKMAALFDDPLEVMQMSVSCGCNDDGSQLCIDPYTTEFPLDSDLSRSLWNMSYEEVLRVALRMIPDWKNDAKPAINIQKGEHGPTKEE